MGNSINNIVTNTSPRINMTEDEKINEYSRFSIDDNIDQNKYKWDSKVDRYSATKEGELGRINYNNYCSGKSTFSNSLFDKMDSYEPGWCFGLFGHHTTRSLAEAYNKLDKTLETYDIETKKNNKQHPQCSENLHKYGWIPTKIHTPKDDDHDEDHHRIAKAIIFVGPQNEMDNPVRKENIEELAKNSVNNDAVEMKNKLKEEYGLNDDDIKILKNPTLKDFREAMENIQGDGGKNSEILVYGTCHGRDHYLSSNNLDGDPQQNIYKNTLIYDVDTFLAPKFKYVNVVIDSCNSGSFIN